MAALDFPNSPTTNQQYAAPNGVTYQWDGAAWVVTGGPPTTPSGPAGGDLGATYPNPTVVKAAGDFTAAGNIFATSGSVAVGAALQRCAVTASSSAGRPFLDLISNLSQVVTTAPEWLVRVDSNLDTVTMQRQAPSGGAWATLLKLDAGGTATVAGNLNVGGSTNGIRFQNVGTAGGDGYSNNIAFGWSGVLNVRVDGTQLGSVNITPPSDARYKHEIENDVPGLDAVLALHPITFAYQQTAREGGFPQGRFYGLIAQDAQPHVPLAIEDDGSAEHYLGLDYRMLVPVLIRAIQELAAKLAAQRPAAAPHGTDA